jgi:hypothetical protein
VSERAPRSGGWLIAGLATVGAFVYLTGTQTFGGVQPLEHGIWALDMCVTYMVLALGLALTRHSMGAVLLVGVASVGVAALGTSKVIESRLSYSSRPQQVTRCRELCNALIAMIAANRVGTTREQGALENSAWEGRINQGTDAAFNPAHIVPVSFLDLTQMWSAARLKSKPINEHASVRPFRISGDIITCTVHGQSASGLTANP